LFQLLVELFRDTRFLHQDEVKQETEVHKELENHGHLDQAKRLRLVKLYDEKDQVHNKGRDEGPPPIAIEGPQDNLV